MFFVWNKKYCQTHVTVICVHVTVCLSGLLTFGLLMLCPSLLYFTLVTIKGSDRRESDRSVYGNVLTAKWWQEFEWWAFFKTREARGAGETMRGTLPVQSFKHLLGHTVQVLSIFFSVKLHNALSRGWEEEQPQAVVIAYVINAHYNIITIIIIITVWFIKQTKLFAW